MKQDISKSSSWSEVYEQDGFKLSVSSSNHPLVYLDVPKSDKRARDTEESGRQGCYVLRDDQLYALRDFVDHAIRDLENGKRWPKKPVMRTRGGK